MARFTNRLDAGKELLVPLAALALPNPAVIALPGPSVAVALPIAHGLGGDLIVGYSEATADTGGVSRGPAARGRMRARSASPGTMFDFGSADRVMAERMHAEVGSSLEHLEHHEELPDVQGRTIILVDDGMVDERVLHATAGSLRAREPLRLIVAMPMIVRNFEEALSSEVDDIIALERPFETGTVNDWYEAAPPSEDDLHQLLSRYAGLLAFRRTVLR